jgi:hypothetical protein
VDASDPDFSWHLYLSIFGGLKEISLNSIEKEIFKCFENERYAQIAVDNRDAYLSNDPYPHMVFDNFLPSDVADVVSTEYPGVDSVSHGNWKFHDNDNVSRFFLEDATQFSDSMRLFSNAVSSRSFLLFLEALTGIPALCPDPYLMGGGAMATGSGGFLNVHVDFNWHQKIQCWRRLNVLFYLTADWSEDWGGALELWSKDGHHVEKKIIPKFNRMVVFNTTQDSFHGQPAPITCPKGIFRRVFSAFYYTSQKGDGIDDHPHFTKYKNSKAPVVPADLTNSPYSQAITDDYLRTTKVTK